MSSPLEDIVEDGCSVLETNEFNLETSILTSPREIKIIIQNLKNIPNILLTNLSRKALVFLTYILNSFFKLSYFPKSWKHSNVVPVPKPGKDLSIPSIYRPISLLSSISKIFERVILKRLQNFITAIRVGCPKFEQIYVWNY
jgi:hypothetical protein